MTLTVDRASKSANHRINAHDYAIDQSLAFMRSKQRQNGSWAGMLESNSCIEAQWIFGMHILGVDDDPKYQGVIQAILNEQREDGSWDIYYGAQMGDVNTTVECYAALSCAGMCKDSEPMVKARAWILKHNAMNKLRVFTKFWLAMIGEWPWSQTPALPPELIHAPLWFPFSIYKFSSWARATIVPLCILSDIRPVVSMPIERRLDELYPNGRENHDFRLVKKPNKNLIKRFFEVADRALTGYQKWRVKPFRKLSKKVCLEWILKHQDADGCWGGIQPPWIFGIIAMRFSGYDLDHPVIDKGLKAWDAHWSYERNGGIYIQASESPIWDTLLTMMAYLDCGQSLQTTPELLPALHYILDEQVDHFYGDWSLTVKDVKPGGWAFESENDHYPDTDDTAVALIVLARMLDQMSAEDRERSQGAIEKAIAWQLAMQSSNGGWGAFDKDNESSIVSMIPFCDFGEALDPPSVDLVGHTLEAFGLLNMDRNHPSIQKAMAYLKSEQEENGSWFGRWGVNYIYGTAAVLPALEAMGEDMSQEWIIKAADWMAGVQNEDGGWGESCASYMDTSLHGKGVSTASQTGWALMSLLAMENLEPYGQAIESGLRFLIERQVDGTWEEKEYTGTGFPGYGLGKRTDVSDSRNHLEQGKELARGFMINYNLYRQYFPMMALGRARKRGIVIE